VQKRPLVIEKERINFEFGFGEPLRTESQGAAALLQSVSSGSPE
jgi:hypothetical protein